MNRLVNFLVELSQAKDAGVQSREDFWCSDPSAPKFVAGLVGILLAGVVILLVGKLFDRRKRW